MANGKPKNKNAPKYTTNTITLSLETIESLAVLRRTPAVKSLIKDLVTADPSKLLRPGRKSQR
jgi:hypothetical protein